MALSNFGANFAFRYICKICLLILAVLGLCCFEGFSLVAASGGSPPVAGFSSCGHRLLGMGPREFRLWPLEHRPVVVVHELGYSMDCGIFLGQGLSLHLPALAGGFFTAEPPGKPYFNLLNFLLFLPRSNSISGIFCLQCLQRGMGQSADG